MEKNVKHVRKKVEDYFWKANHLEDQLVEDFCIQVKSDESDNEISKSENETDCQ